jgi:hypothetical protein
MEVAGYIVDNFFERLFLRLPVWFGRDKIDLCKAGHIFYAC